MRRFLYASSSLLFIVAVLLASPYTVRASEGNDGRQMEVEVDGYHVSLTSENDWAKGENTIVVTLADNMEMPVKNAEVEILITPKSDDHSESETAHGAESTEPEAEMEMSGHGTETADSSDHEEEAASPIEMLESDKHGMYIAETHLEKSGEHEVHVMFLVDGEMLQADFIVDVPGASSRSIVLWSFIVINFGLIASAAILKKQSPRERRVTV